MKPDRRPKVMCVDDDPNVLEALVENLELHFDVHATTNPRQALETLSGDDTFAVVLSDMRMPEMNGATLLGHLHRRAPCTVRMLLTGYSEIDAAIAAINEGHIFRFLTKPCPPHQLLAAFEAAVQQYNLVMAEKVLLEQTLRGSIQTLTDVLALTNPQAFGCAGRIKLHAGKLADKFGLSVRWQLEVAAMLSQLACITLPPETVDKVYAGKLLTGPEKEMVTRLPKVTEQLLGHIPRLEDVRAILANFPKPFREAAGNAVGYEADPVRMGALILRVAVDFDALERQGLSPTLALDSMRGRPDAYAPEVLEALRAIHEAASQADILEIAVEQLKVGMVFADDVRLQTGTLLVARGYETSASLVERIRNFPAGAVKGPLRVRAT